jgi:ABC-type nitrate/sulfonate/bicarbonate transport system substrate-binding protein
MERLRIGGVPEHFNRPWQRLLESGALARRGIDLRWRDFPDGSGAMAEALARGELDAALLLTESAMAGIARSGGFRIASVYTESPLIWGIHVPARSKLASVAQLRGARYAISRFGSGSHWMCFVHAKAQGWPVQALEFVTVGGLEGALAAFAAQRADVFLWEKFMSQPAVNAGHFRRIAELMAPWPAFVLCVADSAGTATRAAIVAALRAALNEAQRFARDPAAAAEVADRYGLEVDTAREWLGATRWAERPGISPEVVSAAAALLREIALLAHDFDDRALLAPL